jgi:epoxyqueuosine reductase
LNASSKQKPRAAIRTELEAQARALGFAKIGITRPDAVRMAGTRLRQWVGQGRHGDMAWMADRIGWRASPEALWPEARSVIMLAEPYTPADTPGSDPLAILTQPDRAAISVYAQGRDYHDVVKKRLKRLGRWLIEQQGGEIKVFVDTAPVMEKPLAQAAGLGWQGKHTNLVSRRLGSWFFLGAIFTTLELAPNQPEGDHCGACRRCLDICPTAAFPAPYQLDARRCISYLTIELKGPIPRQMRPLIGNRIYGCDDCLAVCPWNKFAQAANAAYAPREGTAAPLLVLGILAGIPAIRILPAWSKRQPATPTRWSAPMRSGRCRVWPEPNVSRRRCMPIPTPPSPRSGGWGWPRSVSAHVHPLQPEPCRVSDDAVTVQIDRLQPGGAGGIAVAARFLQRAALEPCRGQIRGNLGCP